MHTPGDCVAEVACANADTVFYFPIVPEKAYGASALERHASGGGGGCKVFKMHTYPDALDIAAGSNSGDVVSVLTMAQALPSMSRNLSSMGREGKSVVVHVVGAAVKSAETLELGPCTAPAYDVAASANAGLVVAADPLDCADSASYAYALARHLRRPVIHLVDGLGLSARTSKVPGAPARAALPPSSGSRHGSTGAAPLELGNFHAYSYSGDARAHTVFVAVGAVVGAARRCVASTAGVGLLQVQLLEPWHEQHLLSKLPASTQLVIVLDYASAAQALYHRVATAVSRSPQLRAVATLSVAYTAAEDTDVARLLQLAASGGRGLGNNASTIHLDQVSTSSTSSALSGRQFKLWWSLESELSQAQQLFAALSAGGGHVDAVSYHDMFRKKGTGVTVTDVLVAPIEHLSHRVCHADMSVVYRTSLLEEVDVFATLRDGGTALINCPQNYLGAHRIVPTDAVARQLKIYHVCAASAGRICRSDADLVLCICAVYLVAMDSGQSQAAAVQTAHRTYPSVPIEMVEYVLYSALMQFATEKALQGNLGTEPGTKPALCPTKVLYTGDGTAAPKQLEALNEEEVFNRCMAVQAPVEYVHRPDLPDTIEFVVQKNVRLTSPTYYRDVFHIELKPRDANHKLTYKPGMVLNIYPKNRPEAVQHLLSELELDGKQFFARHFKSREGHLMEEINTMSHYMTNVLDVFGCPKPSFYRALVDFTDSPMTASLLTAYADNYEAAVDEALTYAEVLVRFKSSVKVPAAELVKGSLIPSVAARSYSIASCTDVVGNRIDLVVVVETWRNKLNDLKAGLCSSYLSSLRSPHPLQSMMVTGNVVSSTSLKIDDYTKPCVCIGLGTGIAPFRAFVQKYFYEREQRGVNVGEIVIYFGARTSADEYLYGHELEQYKLWGIISELRLAFSRDPGQKKTYVQDLIKQDGDLLQRLVLQQQGYIMMCGPDWPVPTIHSCLSEMGIDVNDMMKEGRYLEEVY